MTSPDISVKLGRLSLANPVLVASGTFGYGEEYQDFLELKNIGAIITKAITREPRQGNQPPRIVETTAGMLNAIGLANVGVEEFVRHKMPFLQDSGATVIVNVAGSTLEDYIHVVDRLEDVPGIVGLEINVSCPNVKQGGMSFGVDPKSLTEITRQLRKRTKRFLIIKLTPNVTDISLLAKCAEDAGADCLSLINTLSGMAVDIQTRRSKLANIFGGLSGPAIKPVALAHLYKVRQAVQLPLIGGGGIMSAEDALEFIITGADAVCLGTANFVDPASAEKITAGLQLYCEENSIQNINLLKGTLVC